MIFCASDAQTGVLPADLAQSNAAIKVQGSGDGRIHIVPSVTPYSLVNGETLTVTAMVKSERPIAAVTADLGGKTTVTLSPDLSKGGISTDGKSGAFRADWIAEGLEVKIYQAIFQVTDVDGHSWTDGTVAFSDPAAGISAPGSTAYPDGGMTYAGFASPPGDHVPAISVYDPINDAFYFYNNYAHSITKVLGNGSAGSPTVSPVRISVPANVSEITGGVIDPAAGFAYFGSKGSPAEVVKVALNGTANPAIVATTRLTAQENRIFDMGIDPAAGHLYIITQQAWSSGHRFVKMRLGAGAAAPERIGFVAIGGNPRKVLVDPINKYGYTYDSAGSVSKWNLGAGNLLPSFTGGSASFLAGETPVDCTMIDPVSGNMWFGIGTAPGAIVQFSLGAGAAAPTRLGVTTLPAGERGVVGLGMDPTRRYGFASVFTAFATGVAVVKLDLATAPPTRLGTYNTGTTTLRNGPSALTSTNGFGYLTGIDFTTGNSTLYKVNLGAGAAVPTASSTLPLPEIGGDFNSTAVDSANGYAYTWAPGSPAVISKIKISGNFPEHIATISTTVDSGSLGAIVVDSANGYGYAGSTGTTGSAQIMKFSLGAGDTTPTIIGGLTLGVGETNILNGLIDSADGYAYFVSGNSPSIIVKVALGAGAALPTRVGALTLSSGEFTRKCAIIDEANNKAYFGTESSPGRVVKVSLGSGAAVPTRDGVLSLTASDNFLSAATIDTANQFGYFVTGTNPGRVVKVALLGTTTNVPTINSTLILNTGEATSSFGKGMVMDPTTRQAYLNISSGSSAPTYLRLDFSGATPTRLGTVALSVESISSGSFSAYTSAAYDPARRLLLLGGDTRAGLFMYRNSRRSAVRATKLAMPQNGFLQDVRLYSHQSGGNVRLAIYDNGANPNLLWESNSVANSVTNGEIIVPVTNSPTTTALSLASGVTYWLAWQSDSPNNFASYSLGVANDGMTVAPVPFGNFPVGLQVANSSSKHVNTVSTTERWTQYINYGLTDTSPPYSSVTANPFTNSTVFALPFTAGEVGFGAFTTQLWVRTPGAGSFVATGSGVSGTAGTFSYTAAAGDGVYEFYSRGTDASGNVEAAPGTPDATITLDRIAPVSAATITPTSVSNAPFSISFTASDALVGVSLTRLWVRTPGAGTFTDTGLTQPGSSGSFTYTAASGAGTYEFYTRATDNAGNTEAAPGTADDTVVCELTKPVSLATIATTFPGTTASINFTASDVGSGLASTTLFVRTPGTTTFVSTGQTTASASGVFNYGFAAGSGTYEFYTLATDVAGNVEDAPIVADVVCLFDQVAPTSIASIVPTTVATSPVTVNYTASDAVGIASVRLFVRTPGSGSFVDTALVASGSSGSFSYGFSAGGGLYEFYTVATDVVGNVESAPGSADDTVTLTDGTGPAVVGGIVRLDSPTTTSREHVRFRATFSKPLRAGFGLGNVVPSGSLASQSTATLVSDNNPVYDFAVILADGYTTGSVGITLQGTILDTVGNAATVPITSPLYHFTRPLGDKNYNGQVDVDELNEVVLNYRAVQP